MRALTLAPETPPAPAAVPVEIVTPDPLVRAGVASALRASTEVDLVEGDVSVHRVAVIVVDSVDADAVRSIRTVRWPALLVATSIDTAGSLRAIEAGVDGVLRRRDATEQRLVSAILAVADGTGTVPSDVLGGVLERLGRQRLVTVPAGPDPVAVLDDRERAVLRLLADGHETAEIARTLAYSVRTVTGVVHDITHRLRLRNRAHAVAFALREGLI